MTNANKKNPTVTQQCCFFCVLSWGQADPVYTSPLYICWPLQPVKCAAKSLMPLMNALIWQFPRKNVSIWSLLLFLRLLPELFKNRFICGDFVCKVSRGKLSFLTLSHINKIDFIRSESWKHLTQHHFNISVCSWEISNQPNFYVRLLNKRPVCPWISFVCVQHWPSVLPSQCWRAAWAVTTKR